MLHPLPLLAGQELDNFQIAEKMLHKEAFSGAQGYAAAGVGGVGGCLSAGAALSGRGQQRARMLSPRRPAPQAAGGGREVTQRCVRRVCGGAMAHILT